MHAVLLDVLTVPAAHLAHMTADAFLHQDTAGGLMLMPWLYLQNQSCARHVRRRMAQGGRAHYLIVVFVLLVLDAAAKLPAAHGTHTTPPASVLGTSPFCGHTLQVLPPILARPGAHASQ